MENTYNGWKNYYTWAVALWLDYNEGIQKYFRAEAEEAKRGTDDADEQKQWLSERVKEFVEENAPEIPASMYSDLMSAALSEVDYYEIASNMLEY